MIKYFALITLAVALVNADSYHMHDKPKRDAYRRYAEPKHAEDEEDKDFWLNYGRDELEMAQQMATINSNIAKNVIIFIGDGMSIPTLTAARIYKSQTKNPPNWETPERDFLFFERFNHLGHSKTFDTDYQIPDSASTASAMFSGVKTKYYTLGYDSSIDHYDSASMLTARNVTTFISWAQEAGKDTGVVSTAKITHATPAATYAHTFDRDFECQNNYDDLNGTMPLPPGHHDIAWQLVNQEPGNKLKVIMGGGWAAFLQNMTQRPDTFEPYYGTDAAETKNTWEYCFRGDDETDLTEQWLMDHTSNTTKAELVLDTHDLDYFKSHLMDSTDYLMALMAEYHIRYDDEYSLMPHQPSLTDMVEVAVPMLMKNKDKGFALMVEGGRVDHAHHDTKANRALQETVALDRAVERTVEMLDAEGRLEETLIIVTADHAHTMSIAGYARRGNPIGGLSENPDGSLKTYDDGLPYTTLSYANGEDYNYHNIANGTQAMRHNLTGEDTSDFHFRQTNSGLRYSETHGGDDVAIFARGPMSHLFHTTHDQTHIAHVMGYAACMGPYKNEARCTGSNPTQAPPPSNPTEGCDCGEESGADGVTLTMGLLIAASFISTVFAH